MSILNMLTITLHLDPQPGGVSPELHLKEGSTSVEVELLIMAGDALSDTKQKYSVLKGIRPDGEEIFVPIYTGIYDDKVLAKIPYGDMGKLTGAAGSYTCTLTLLDTSERVSRETYMNYNFLTVIPFTVIVHEKAGRDETC